MVRVLVTLPPQPPAFPASAAAFATVVAAVAGERLAEVALSRRNVRRLLAIGAVEERSYSPAPAIVLNALWLLASPLEVFLLHRPWIPALGTACAALLGASMVLRAWSMGTLGDRWNIRLLAVPGEPLALAGPYRFLRHPSYLAAAVELYALPLLHTAWLTAAVLGTFNLFLLRRKARLEERVLARLAAPSFHRRADSLNQAGLRP